MKESAGRVLMLVENCFPADTRGRNEAFTLTENGFKVSVIALRGNGEKSREIVERRDGLPGPATEVFAKLPRGTRSRLTALLDKLLVGGRLRQRVQLLHLGLSRLSFYVASRRL